MKKFILIILVLGLLLLGIMIKALASGNVPSPKLQSDELVSGDVFEKGFGSEFAELQNENQSGVPSSAFAQSEDCGDPEVSIWEADERDIEYIAKTLYGECRGVQSTTEKAAVAWCILNRVDASGFACGDTIEDVVTFPHQFAGYDYSNPVLPELKALAEDVLMRWHDERDGVENVGRVLPREYIFFDGDGKHNYFTIEFLGQEHWDFSLHSPYSD